MVEGSIAVQRRTVSGGARIIGIHLGFDDFRKTMSRVSTRNRSDEVVKCGKGLEMRHAGSASLRLKTLSQEGYRIGIAHFVLHRVVKVWRWWVSNMQDQQGTRRRAGGCRMAAQGLS